MRTVTYHIIRYRTEGDTTAASTTNTPTVTDHTRAQPQPCTTNALQPDRAPAAA
ncbi:MAG: hypothetical protein FalmKO_17700 [Falsiruegeria mediterranea]